MADTAIVARQEQTAISQQQDVQRRLSLVATLTELAEARQAAVSQETLTLYAECLSEFDLADVRRVARGMAMQRRADGETAFPILGDLTEPLRRIRWRRREAEEQERIRQAEIAEFWERLPWMLEITGLSEEQMLERWPKFKGTKAGQR